MKILILEKYDICGFWPVNIKKFDIDNNLCILIDFLRFDVGCYRSSFEKWVRDDNTELNSGGNETILEKENNNIIITLDRTNEELIMSKQSFIQMLEDWKRLCKERPEVVIMKWDGANVIFETSSYDIRAIKQEETDNYVSYTLTATDGNAPVSKLCTFNKETGSLLLEAEKTDSYFIDHLPAIEEKLMECKKYNKKYPDTFGIVIEK
jgi:hypothetical protein